MHNILGYLEWGCQISWDAKYPVTPGTTVWQGTAFRECVRNDILLLHSQFRLSEGAHGSCNNGAIVAQSLRGEEIAMSHN